MIGEKLLRGICLFTVLLAAGCGKNLESGREDNVSQNMATVKVSGDMASGNEAGDAVSGNESDNRNLLKNGEVIELSNGLYAGIMTQVPEDIAIEGITEWIMIQDRNPDEDFSRFSDRRTLIPNVYGTITDIRMEDYSKISICYEDEEGKSRQAAIVLDFYPSEDNVIEPAFRWEQCRCLCLDIEELTDETVFPKEVWSEEFTAGGETYKAVYSRISPIYTGDIIEGRVLTADYQFVILQDDEILYEVKMYQMRVRYEDVHYMEDVNGDGIEDFIQLGNSGGADQYDMPYIFIWDQEQKNCIYGGPISTKEKALYEGLNGGYDDPRYSSVCYDRDSRTFYDDSLVMYWSITDNDISGRIVSCGARFVDGEWKTVYEMYLGEDYARETRYDEKGNVVSEEIYTLEEYIESTLARYDTYDLEFFRYEGYTVEDVVVNGQFSYGKYVRNEE